MIKRREFRGRIHGLEGSNEFSAELSMQAATASRYFGYRRDRLQGTHYGGKVSYPGAIKRAGEELFQRLSWLFFAPACW